MKGIDAAIKRVILANTIWNMGASLDRVDITGIDLLTTDALRLAEEKDLTIRLIAHASPKTEVLRVSPRIIKERPSPCIRSTLNAITLETDMAGKITLIGKVPDRSRPPVQ